MAETSVEVSSSPCLQERSALRSSLPVLSPTPLLTSRRPCQSRLQTTSVLSSPSCCNREGPAGRVQKEILLNSEENKEFEITVRQHVLKRRKRLHHSFMTSHSPPMLHRFCFTGISFESIFFLLLIIVSSRKTCRKRSFCHHWITAINVQNTHLKSSSKSR